MRQVGAEALAGEMVMGRLGRESWSSRVGETDDFYYPYIARGQKFVLRFG